MQEMVRGSTQLFLFEQSWLEYSHGRQASTICFIWGYIWGREVFYGADEMFYGGGEMFYRATGVFGVGEVFYGADEMFYGADEVF